MPSPSAEDLQPIGIKDIYVKVSSQEGSYSPYTHAFTAGPLNQETFQQVAERKGLHVVEMPPSRHFLPEKIASPIGTGLKTEDELLSIDVLNLDDGEGRYPLRKPKVCVYLCLQPAPFYANRRKQPFRNHKRVMHTACLRTARCRVGRVTLAARYSELALAGVEPLSTSIDLSHVVPKKE
ncbi:hypothetical protein PFISCL1PPCAC_812 [Pristionchus fissidentatus]|uniref:Uncharacterized protein n=1 Tax=Pristionchus fissidentatus TaxID=1538716 RepID=A0AAV5UQQ7_9BILA|nr:hypothetical protein PFISCL1PPCAC_812 [Pristionchus fissidentatus]